jgi:hypothetical protein
LSRSLGRGTGDKLIAVPLSQPGRGTVEQQALAIAWSLAASGFSVEAPGRLLGGTLYREALQMAAEVAEGAIGSGHRGLKPGILNTFSAVARSTGSA